MLKSYNLRNLGDWNPGIPMTESQSVWRSGWCLEEAGGSEASQTTNQRGTDEMKVVQKGQNISATWSQKIPGDGPTVVLPAPLSQGKQRSSGRGHCCQPSGNGWPEDEARWSQTFLWISRQGCWHLSCRVKERCKGSQWKSASQKISTAGKC